MFIVLQIICHVQDDAQGDTDPDFDPRAELEEEEDQGKMRTRPRNKLVKFSRMSHKVRYGKIIGAGGI